MHSGRLICITSCCDGPVTQSWLWWPFLNLNEHQTWLRFWWSLVFSSATCTRLAPKLVSPVLSVKTCVLHVLTNCVWAICTIIGHGKKWRTIRWTTAAQTDWNLSQSQCRLPQVNNMRCWWKKNAFLEALLKTATIYSEFVSLCLVKHSKFLTNLSSGNLSDKVRWTFGKGFNLQVAL